MKIEKINENSISLTINKEDLIARNLDIKDLSYGSEKAKILLNELIVEANKEVGFKADAPLSVEVVPFKEGNIKLIITKLYNMDELDSRFSRFTPYKPEDLSMNIMKALEATFDKFEEALKSQQYKGVNEVNTGNKLEIKHENEVVCIFEFEDIDKASDGCSNVKYYDYVSVFYKDEKNKKFYLVLSTSGEIEKEKLTEFNKVCNMLAEYGNRVQGGLGMNQAYYEEHYKVIIKENAVKKLATI